MIEQEQLRQFANELRDIKRCIARISPEEEYTHLRKIIWANRSFLIIGFSLSIFYVNPLAMILISIGLTNMWAIVMHHVSHGAYNSPSIPSRYHAKQFAHGWRRYVDWVDWIYPPAWAKEHNYYHHMHINELADADQISYVIDKDKAILLIKKLPTFLQNTALFFMIISWKIHYYPRTAYAHFQAKKYPVHAKNKGIKYYVGLALSSFVPYIFYHYVILILPFAFIDPSIAWTIFFNRIGAEFLTNLHTYFIIVPSHTGSDLYLMNNHYNDQPEFYLAQIISSSNYATGGFWCDYFHGYLNYQIEHHLFPNLSPLKYQKIQHQVKALCQKYKIPYVQESIFQRAKKQREIILLREKMQEYTHPG